MKLRELLSECLHAEPGPGNDSVVGTPEQLISGGDGFRPEETMQRKA